MATFTLNTSKLAGNRFVSIYTDETTGEFRTIQYQITENNNSSDLELHAFTAGITVGSDSTETF